MGGRTLATVSEGSRLTYVGEWAVKHVKVYYDPNHTLSEMII